MQMLTNAARLLAARRETRGAIRDTMTKHCLRERESDAGFHICTIRGDCNHLRGSDGRI